MRKILGFIGLCVIYFTVLFVSNWVYHDRIIVFDRDFIIVLAMLIIWAVASLLVMLFLPDRDFVKKDGEEPSNYELFMKNRKGIILFCILIFTTFPLFFYMATSKAPLEPIKLVACIAIALLCSIWHILETINSLRRKWRKDNPKQTDRMSD